MTTAREILIDQENRSERDKPWDLSIRLKSAAEWHVMNEWFADVVRAEITRRCQIEHTNPVPGGGKGRING